MIPLSVLSVALFLATPTASVVSLPAVGSTGAVNPEALRCTTLRDVSGHTTNITKVAYSPDGKFLFTGSRDGVVVQWDTATGQPVHTRLAGELPRFAVFNVTSTGTLVVDSLFGEPKLVDMTTGEELSLALKPVSHAHYAPLPAPFYRGVTLSPNGETVAVLDPFLLRLFDRKTGVETGYVAAPDNSGGLGAFAYSPDGKQLVVSARRQLLLVDTTTHEIKTTLRGAPDDVTIIAFSPDGQRIAAGGSEGDVILWDVATGAQLRSISAHKIQSPVAGRAERGTISLPSMSTQAGTSGLPKAQRHIRTSSPPAIMSLAFSPNGRQFVTSSRDGLVAVWNADTGEQLHAESEAAGAGCTVALSPDGQTLAVSGEQNPKLWDMHTWQSHYLIAKCSPAAVSSAFAPDGKTFVVGLADGAAELWDTQTRRLARSIQAHSARVRYTAFSSDGKQLITAADNKDLRVWNVMNGREATTKALSGPGYPMALSRDGRLLAVSGWAGGMEVWDTMTAQRVHVLKQEEKPLYAAFSADGSQLAVSDRKGDVALWNTLTGQEVRAIVNKDWGAGTPIAFTGDGSKMADGRGRVTAEGSGTIMQVWNTQTGQEVTWLRDKHQYGNQIVFSPDGRWLAMNATPDHTIVLFDVVSRKSVELKGHVAYVTTLTFSPDSTILLSADQGGAIKLWSLR